VDRLLKSPAKQKGRDFSIILKSLNELGYAVEWRVINAAEYGMPQRRRRVFFLGYHKSTDLYKRLSKTNKLDWILNTGVITKAFPANNAINNYCDEFELKGSLVDLSDSFNKNGKTSPFLNSGVALNGKIVTTKTIPHYKGQKTFLGDILQNGEVTEEFFIDKNDFSKWAYLKGAKKEIRKTKEGFEYHYSEGGMIFPDALDNASRTIITGEGGSSPSRFKHVVEIEKGLRRLTPIELERLNMFPDDHTKLEGISNTKRAYFMGNALVVGVIDKIGKILAQDIKV
jgi:DNA (cytosine-5)-methyltransferase 1